MSFALKMRGVANKLLTKFDERSYNKQITLIRTGESVYNPVTREHDFPLPVETSLTGVVVPYNSSQINGTTIQDGDAKMTVTSEHKPKHPDKIRLDGVEWSVTKVQPYNYTGDDLTIAYSVNIRK